VRASDRVWARVCGLPSGKRKRRRLMVWRAFIDDSGNEPNAEVYVLGGFIAPYERWAAFSDEWQAELERDPTIEYFKFTQARALKGEFDDRKGWTPTLRDSRVQRLAQIAQNHALYHLTAAMRHEHFSDIVLRVPAPTRSLVTDHPYHSLFGRAAGAVALIALNTEILEPVDCIFDLQQGFETEAFSLWRKWQAELLHPNGTPLLGTLNFENEQDFVPLQAADMLAGSARHYQMTGEILPEFQTLLGVPGFQNDWKGQEVKDRAIEMLLMAECAVTRDPRLPLIEFNKQTARRQRKNARKKKPAP
jgi:Protein of unknown function (DUF3800)